MAIGRLLPLRNDEVQRDSSVDLDVGACRVEMGIVRNDVAGLQNGRKEQVLGDPPLVRGNDVGQAEDLSHRLLEEIEVAPARVRLVPAHETGPLPVGHGRSSRVRQQIDENVLRRDVEEVVARLAQANLALLARDAPDGLNDLDSPGLRL